MAKTLTLKTEIPPSRELWIALPAEVLTGFAEIIITVSPAGSSTVMTCLDFLDSEFFGVCRERADIEDSLDFARKLRSEDWKRPAR